MSKAGSILVSAEASVAGTDSGRLWRILLPIGDETPTAAWKCDPRPEEGQEFLFDPYCTELSELGPYAGGPG
jgi:hypothetical protein